MAEVDLTHHFLIAMPSMADPYFSRSLTYICEHNPQGALGIVVNRPIDMTLSSLLERLELSLARNPSANSAADGAPVYFGGPVQTDRGFVLHQPIGQWQATLPVRGMVGLTTSRDILEAVEQGAGPQRMIVALGYSGWSAGQLEEELKRNAWLTVEAQDGILFDLPAEARLEAAMSLLGVDFATLSEDVGHA